MPERRNRTHRIIVNVDEDLFARLTTRLGAGGYRSLSEMLREDFRFGVILDRSKKEGFSTLIARNPDTKLERELMREPRY